MADEAGWSSLTKSERRKLAREQKQKEIRKEDFKSGALKKGVLVLVVLILAYGGYRSWQWVNTPVEVVPQELLSGVETLPDIGANHIQPGESVEYNSEPPTSGPHYLTPAKAGFYDEPLEDGNLVHSLEHGYIVISYNCDGLDEEVCGELKASLESVYKDKGKGKIVVVPRPGLDSRIALTAWTKLDKFDEFDQARIERFIDSFRNRGPENAP